MLDAWIIEEIKKQEEEKRREIREQPRIFPYESYEPSPSRKREEQEKIYIDNDGINKKKDEGRPIVIPLRELYFSR